MAQAFTLTGAALAAGVDQERFAGLHSMLREVVERPTPVPLGTLEQSDLEEHLGE